MGNNGTGPQILITLDKSGNAVLQSNVPKPQTKAMLAGMLNAMIQEEAREHAEAERKIVVPQIFVRRQ
jgi:hypothetical protein